MKQYKLSYTFNLKGNPGNFCIDPASIFQQMEKAQNNILRQVRKMIADENLQPEVKTIQPLRHENAILLTCSEEVAKRLETAEFLTSIEELQQPQKPPKTPGFGN